MRRTRLLAAAGAVVLAGAATAIAGPIGFVGLVVPHVVRTVVGSDHRWLLPLSAVGGSVLLVLADVVGASSPARPRSTWASSPRSSGPGLRLDRAPPHGARAVSVRTAPRTGPAVPVTTATTAVAALRAGRRGRTRRHRLVVAALALLLLGACLVALMVGNTFYGPDEVLRVVLGQRVPGRSFTVGGLRLPRTCLAALAGLAFGAAGVTFQTLLRNALAAPDVIGISSGASAAGVIAIVVLSLDDTWVAVVALAGALVTAAVIHPSPPAVRASPAPA